jgi:uncharacterized protein YbbK (DUF523 family)
MKLVSACLAGYQCRYDGEDNTCRQVVDLVREGLAIPVCPEQLGGLKTPRNPSEIVNDREEDIKVMTKDGRDVTQNFLQGAFKTLRIAKLYNIHEAILKAKSPSCGCGQIYDGTFTGKLIEGDGVTTRILKKNGIKVQNTKNI